MQRRDPANKLQPPQTEMIMLPTRILENPDPIKWSISNKMLIYGVLENPDPNGFRILYLIFFVHTRI